jgi:hypothetical protein
MQLCMCLAMLDAKVLSEPKGAASAAWERWQAGESAEQVATARKNQIQVWRIAAVLVLVTLCWEGE